MYDFTNVDPVKCCAWLVLPTVYDESLSYGEQLNKFCKALNELIENNNNIPDYVANMIQQYITSGAIDEVVRNILANYILNVKYPPKGIAPAAGDGSADDTDAIQGCIDYAFNQGGGCVYFPYGKYLSRSLTLRSGVSLVGFDRYSTKIVQRGGDTKPLVSGGNVQKVQVSNLTLDGNNEVQTDDLDVVNVLGKDVLLTNLVIKSGYQCLVYNGLGGDLQVSNVVFGGAVKKVAVINGKDSVQFENVKFNELGKVNGECVLEVGASDGVYRFSSKAVTPTCISVSGSRNSFICDITNANNNLNDTGALNNFNVLGAEVKEQLAKEKNYSGGSITENINGGKTEVISENKTETISSNKTETIGNNKTETINGSKTETITQNKTENITGNREIDIGGTDSVHIDGVSSINIGGARTEVYGNSRTIGVTGINTEEYHNTMTETFDNKHIVNGNDETSTFSGNVSNNANKFSFTSKEKSFPIRFPDKTIDLYDFSKANQINLVTIGDSYGTGESGGILEKNIPWTKLVPQYLNLNIHYSNALGGAGLLEGRKTFITLLIELADTLSESVRNTITHVLLAGGYNDKTNSVDDNKNALNLFIKKSQELFPNAMVMCCCIGWSSNNEESKDIVNNVIPAYADVGRFGGYNPSNICTAFHNYSWFDDAIHPNQTGQNYISSKLVECLLYGNCNVYYPLHAIKINGTFIGYEFYHNGIVSILLNSVYKWNTTSLNVGNDVEVGTFDCDYFNGLSGQFNSFSFDSLAHETSGRYTILNCLGSIRNKKLFMYTNALNDEKTSYYQFTTLDSVDLHLHRLDFSYMYL